MVPPSISSELYNFGIELIEFINENDQIQPSQLRYTKEEIDLEYSLDGKRARWDREEEGTIVWGQETISLVKDEIQTFESYDSLIEVLENYNYPSEMIVFHFVDAVLTLSLYGIDDSQLLSLIELVTSEIQNSPQRYHPIIFIEGLRLEPDNIELPNQVELRQPRPADLEYNFVRYPSYHNPFEIRPPRLPDHSKTSIPDMVLEFEERVSNKNEIIQKIDQTLIMLQLYSIGSMEVIAQELNLAEIVGQSFIQTDSFMQKFRHWQYKSQRPGLQSAHDTRSYDLTSDDVSNFISYFEDLSNPVKTNLIDTDKETPLNISYDRYLTAITQTEKPERQLTSGIMSLEALILRDEEQGELSERLSRRIAILLDYFDYQPFKTKRKLKEAYKIRSQYVHGSKLNEEHDISALTDSVLDYSRQSLVCFLKLSETKSKTEVVSKIDNASLHPNARNSLTDLLTNHFDS